MLEALIAGQRDPHALAELAKRRLRSKIPALTEALTGRFTDHHAFLARVHLDLIDQHTRSIDELTGRIEVVIEPFRLARQVLCTIPGVATAVADVMIAETGADMTRFPTPGHLASWAGTCPGSNESAGHVKSTRTRPGNPYLKGALGVAAMAAARSKNTYLSAKYRRVATRRGPVKAIVALEHAILIATWHMLTTNTVYNDPGGDYYTRRDPDKTRDRAMGQLRALGYTVTLQPLPATG
jgi:transposase